jgi:hypothetical protein
MKTKLFLVVKYILIIIISLGLLFFAFRGVDIRNIINSVLHADMLWASISGLISVLAFTSRSYRWKLLIEPMGYSPSLKKTTYSLMVGYFANLAFPRLGEVSRCGALSKAESIPFNKLLGTVIIERIIDVLSLLICMLLAAILEYKRLGNFFNENIIGPLYQKFVQLSGSPFLLLVIVILLIAMIWTGLHFYKKKTNTAESGFSKIIRGFIDGLRSVAKLKRPGLFIFHSVFIWVLYYLGVYVCLFAFPFTGNLGAGTALFLLVAGGLGMSAPVQGGIGAYHLLVSQGLILYGLSKQDGLTFATMLHSLQLILVVILGVISMFLLFRGSKRKQQNQSA